MTRLFMFVGALGICSGLFFTDAWGFPTPVFYTPLENEADSITNNPTTSAGSTPVDNFAFVPGVSGNAFQSTNSGTNNGGWAKWNDATITSMFGSWVNGNGITVDLYFGGTFSAISGTVNEGLWSMVRRNSAAGGGGDQYLFASVQGTVAL